MFTKTRKVTRLSLTPDSLAAGWLPPIAYTWRPMTALRITKPKPDQQRRQDQQHHRAPW